MQPDEWRTNWQAFVEQVAREVDQGATDQELSKQFGSQRVRWKGRVLALMRIPAMTDT